MDNHEKADAAADRLWELVSDIEIAMLVSRAPGGQMVSRPLMTLDVDFEGDLWFLTNIASGTVDDVALDPHVNVTYADPDRHLYVSVVGRANILRDRQRIDELWQPRLDSFLPGGKDDPDLCLLKVEVESAEYWQQSGGLVTEALRLMRSVTGQGPTSLAENGELDLRS